MTKSKHTPGPWDLGVNSYNAETRAEGDVLVKKTGKRIAYTGSVHTDREVNKANARLIAAAPELLEALENITAGLNDEEDTMPLIRGSEVKAARKAIAKARGES